MTEVKQHPPGAFCWVDLATTDAQAAKDFYTRLFGWQATEVPVGEAGTYTILGKGGKNVCALYAMTGEMKKQQVPPHWQSYVSVTSADESARKAEELGGTIVAPALDAMEAGRMAVFRDPTGAPLALWQPKQHVGAEVTGEPGTVCWNELYTKDPERASKFYAALFGWAAKSTKSADGQDYIEFRLGDRGVGGMLEIREEWGDVPPHWAVYFAVEDCDATLEQAKSLGGNLEVAPMDIENVGRFAILQDPQGAHFAVIQLKQDAA
jgi:predicted enzyme related to lactoylglutathione lyase